MAVARFYFALNHGRSDDRYFLSTVPAPRKRFYQVESLALVVFPPERKTSASRKGNER
jgi:hypothetical protein